MEYLFEFLSKPWLIFADVIAVFAAWNVCDAVFGIMSNEYKRLRQNREQNKHKSDNKIGF